MKSTENNITALSSNEIFVFGSNEAGRHGKGAAKTALKWGAKYGQAKGLQGRTYGIPTKTKDVRLTLSIAKIKFYVDEFINFATENQHLIFLVTEIGCGLAGYKPQQIAPLFSDAIHLENVKLPKSFIQILIKNK